MQGVVCFSWRMWIDVKLTNAELLQAYLCMACIDDLPKLAYFSIIITVPATMSEQLPFLNFSLKKTLETEPDSFLKARISIVYTVVLFSLFKACIVIGVGVAHEQWLQVVRAGVAFAIYAVLGKILLYRPVHIMKLAHIMIVIGMFFVWTNIFVYAHKINLVTVQFVFMIMLSSFYTLGNRWAIIYSTISSLPVLLMLFLHGNTDISFAGTLQEFASPGYEIIVLLNFVSIVLSHYLFYQAFSLNIKEKERLNLELQLAVVEARKMAESKTNFLSTISHELRTPLNSVIGISELLISDKPEPRQKENLTILQYAAQDLLSLINNVLDFNKVDSDNVVLEKVPFRLAEFMENICLGLKVKAEDKGLDFRLEIDEQLVDVNVMSDTTRLSQLVYNLVSNAIKFTEKGSVTVKLEHAGKTGKVVNVSFSVTDTGIGIHPDRHHTIFDLFTQAESDTTRKYGGTGLGLAIVKQVLTLFHSEICMESSLNIGTRFSFTIPFTTTAAVATTMRQQAQAAGGDLSHLKILVAEDNNFNRLIIKKQFDMLNIEPVIVDNGELAYEAHLADQYHAIFIDLHMPVRDGYETTRLIRAIEDAAKSKVYIIAFTASVTEQQKITESGFDDYLYKPVNMKDLREKLEHIDAHHRTLTDGLVLS
ncbi:MAG: hypothetical protein JWQ38_3533 [Flavipsychrobacter sp.]|nr:hypothetical protein [Flavipsychrobacter sp.]